MRKLQIYAFILTGIFLLWLGAHAVIQPTQGAGKVIESFSEIPLTVGDWTGEDYPMDEVSIKFLPNCSLFNRIYSNSGGYSSNLTMVYGVDLGDFHQPEFCLEGQGWKRTTLESVEIKSQKPHKAIMLTMTGDYQNIVVLYWFASRGSTSVVLGRHKYKEFLERLSNKSLQPSALVRFISPIEGDLEQTKRHTLELAEELDPHIMKMLSKPPVFKFSEKAVVEE
jgi:EpsI family protein